MPTSSKAKSKVSYASMWKRLTKYAIEPAVNASANRAHKRTGSQKSRGGKPQLSREWFKPIHKLKQKASRVKRVRKTRTQKNRGGFIRGGSRVLPTFQEQCSLVQ